MKLRRGERIVCSKGHPVGEILAEGPAPHADRVTALRISTDALVPASLPERLQATASAIPNISTAP